MRPSRARELGVSLSPFAAGGGVDGSARAGVGARLWLAGARDRADDCGIERELRSVPERKVVVDDLDAPRVAHRDVDVHVSDPDVARNACASLPTDAGDGMLERIRGAKTPDVAHAEQWSPSGSRRPRQRQTRGVRGSGSRRRRSKSTRRCSGGRATAADVGRAVRARPEWGPACESSGTRG